MKKLFYSIAAIVFTVTVLISITSFQKQNTSRIAKKPIATKGFVVMELFTSQGCSSCPAADEILGNYAKTNDGNIFPISFHVDYWNRLGWVDSFSNPAYTLRQNEYASKFNLESIYTPQLIINGQKELVGSDDEKIATAKIRVGIDTGKNCSTCNKCTERKAKGQYQHHPSATG